MAVDGEFERCYLKELPRVVALASYLLGSRSAGEDVAQDVFSSLLRTGDLSAIENTAAWLRTATVRRCLNEQRRRGREHAANRRSAPPAEAPATSAPGDPDLAEALLQLAPNQRAAVLLVYGDGLTPVEAAKVIGCAAATVRVHLHRARTRLRAVLSDTTAATAVDSP